MTNSEFETEFSICVHYPVKLGPLTKLSLLLNFKLLNPIKFNFASNSGCHGDYCLYIINSLFLRKNFLLELKEFFGHGNVQAAYSNYINIGVKRESLTSRPPEWSPERFLGNFYLGSVIAINGNSNFPDSSYEKLFTFLMDAQVKKINLFGYWNLGKNSVLPRMQYEVVSKYLAESRPLANALLNKNDKIEVSYKNYAPNLISVIVPTRGTKSNNNDQTLIYNLTKSLNKQDLENSKIELVVVYDTDCSFDYLDKLFEVSDNLELKFVPYDPPFNFSKKSNLGAFNSSGEVLIFLNDDTEFISQDALLELAGTALVKNVGAVGAKLFFENKSIQHDGIVVIGGNVGHAYFKQHDKVGVFGDLQVIHEVSGVTGACFAQQRNIWSESGGWDETFENSYNDVEYSFRLRELGYSILINNKVELFHFESLTRDPSYSPNTKQLLDNKWSKYLDQDDLFFPEYVFSQKYTRKFQVIIRKILRKLRIS